MNVKRLTKQYGTFSIEVALVALALSLLLAFTADIVIKQSYKGKLDRLSFSMVSLLRERTQLYDNNALTKPQVNNLHKIIIGSLKRTVEDFSEDKLSVIFEQVRFKDKKPSGFFEQKFGSIICGPTKKLSELVFLSPKTMRDRKLPLYQVTICYQAPSLLNDIFGLEDYSVKSFFIALER
jgi:tight adherence protein F